MSFTQVVNEADFENVKKLCAEFFVGNWSDLNRIKVNHLAGMGVASKMFVATLDTEGLVCHEVVTKVIVRLFGQVIPMVACGDAAEAIVMDAMHRAGIGPAVLGVFPGGRLEEFVNCRTLTSTDVRNLKTLTAIAQRTAAMHSLDVPIKKNAEFFRTNYYNVIKLIMKPWRGRDLSEFSDEVRPKIRRILDADSLALWDWMSRAMDAIKHRSRVVLGRFDNHSLNYIVKDNEESRKQIREEDVLVIDVEMMNYYYRGLDIGVFLYECTYNFENVTNLKLVGELEESLKRHFIREYLKKWKELNPDKFDEAIDNEENIWLESHILATGLSSIFPPTLMTKIEGNPAVADLLSKTMLDYACDVRLDWDMEMVRRSQVLLAKEGITIKWRPTPDVSD